MPVGGEPSSHGRWRKDVAEVPNEGGDYRVAVRPQRVVPQLERVDALPHLAERIARRVIPDSLHDRYAREAVVEVHVTRPEDVLIDDERRQ